MSLSQMRLAQPKSRAAVRTRASRGASERRLSLREPLSPEPSSAGAPLPARFRVAAEGLVGADRAHVRVHTGPEAHRLAAAHHARAFAYGRHIVFGAGHYQPASAEGRRLLAHELAHVLQQGRGGGGPAGAPHEAAADGFAAALSAGRRRPSPGPPAAVGIQRTPLSAEEIARLDLAAVEARIAANERETEPQVLSPEYRQRLANESVQLQRRRRELTGASGSTPTAPAATPETERVITSLTTELSEVTPLVARIISAGVLVNPSDYALNTVRGLDQRLRQDQQVTTDIAAANTAAAAAARAAAERFRTLQTTLGPALTAALARGQPGGRVPRDVERAGRHVAGRHRPRALRARRLVLRQRDLGVRRFLGRAFLEAGEQLFSFGFHDAATAVSQAYTAGEISWSEGAPPPSARF
jgi:hypothetical protein